MDKSRWVRNCLVYLSHEFDQDLYNLLLREIRNPKAICRLLMPPSSIPLVQANETISRPLLEKTVAGIPVGELAKGGVSVFGKVGFGKTAFLLGFITLAKELGDLDFLVLDPKGLSYRQLARKFDDVVIIPWKSLSLNLLVPPEGADRTNWLNNVVFLLSEMGLVQADIAVKRALSRLYERFEKPHMGHLLEELENANKNTYGVKTQWIETARAMVVRLCQMLGACVFAADNRQLEYIFQPGKIIVIETAGLVGSPDTFLVGFLLLFLRYLHIARNYSGGLLRRIIGVEEGGLGVLRKQDDHILGGASFMSQHISTYAREFGLPIIGLAQNPSEINPVFRNNVAASITFRLDANEAEQMKDLGEFRQRVTRLAEREVVLQLKHRYLEPIVGSTFDIPPGMLEGVTDAELAGLMKSEWKIISGLRTDVRKSSVTASTENSQPDKTAQAKGDKKQPYASLSKGLKAVILDIYRPNPYLFLGEYSDVAKGLSRNHIPKTSATLKKRFDELVVKGYLIEHNIKRTRGKGVAFELTDRGKAYMMNASSEAYSLPLLHGSDYLHSFKCYRVRDVIEARNPGSKAEVSFWTTSEGSGRIECDIACRSPDGSIDLVEVELGARNMTQSRVRRFLKIDNVRSLTILVEQERVQEMKKLEINNKVRVDAVHRYMRSKAEIETEKQKLKNQTK